MSNDVIKLLPDSVANQIAAGEVIQRPASVIKELVENSIDAGATSITIILKDAGRTLIQVVDNGCGMSPTDARMAFDRHATSKISSAEDLFSLHTMGFRGEALPSIAAVAQIDLRTMRRSDTVGTRVTIAESRFESQEPVSCVPGTNLMVKNLFFHIPARRRFLKKDSVELGHILREFEKLALVNTSVDFTLIHNDITLHQFMHGSFKQRIADLFGKTAESQIASVETETSLVKITGFTGMPRFARKRSANQFMFVNGRHMRHPYFHKAILSCYDRLIAPDSQPSYFINFEVDPSTIDVNIHPQKHEIKFEHEQAIWQILVAAIKETLGRVHAAGALDFDVEDAPDIPLFQPDEKAEAPDVDFDPGYNPFADPAGIPSDGSGVSPESRRRPSSINAEYGYRGATRTERPPQDWDKLYDNFSRQRDDSFAELDQIHTEIPATGNMSSPETSVIPDSHGERQNPDNIGCLQIKNRYIATPSKNGLMLIDQNRAHIRILFDRYMASFSQGETSSQRLIFPEVIELSPAQNATIESLAGEMTQAGYDIVYLGDCTWAINGVPSQAGDTNPRDIILELIDSPQSDILGQPLENTALAMARAGAIKHGQTLSRMEMDSIVAELFRSDTPDHTPDGLPILRILNTDELAQLFTS